MLTVYKYPITVPGRFTLEMPACAEILTVQMQGIEPRLWALIETAAPLETRSFCCVGTGPDFVLSRGERPSYIASFQEAGGGLVWHAFELTMTANQDGAQ